MSTLKSQLESELEKFYTDYDKFSERGNSAAGTRARKSLQEIKKIANEIRKEIIEKRNA